jgi:hypothetical protein
MVRNLCERLTTKPLFVSDELAHYKRALAEQHHAVVPYERAGQRGRPRKPKVVTDDDLQYCAADEICLGTARLDDPATRVKGNDRARVVPVIIGVMGPTTFKEIFPPFEDGFHGACRQCSSEAGAAGGERKIPAFLKYHGEVWSCRHKTSCLL